MQGQFQTGQLALDVGITDLMVVEQNGEAVLYASSGQNGGLTAFDLDPHGSVSVLDTAMFNSSWADDALNEMCLVNVNGAMCIAVAGSGVDQLHLYDVNADGSIAGAQQMSGISSSMTQLMDVDQTDAATLFMADSSSGMLSGYTINTNGSLSQSMQVADTAQTYAAEVMAISSATVMQSEYVISASQSEGGVSVYRLDGNGLVNTGNAGVNEGLGIMTPTDMEVVTIGDRTFILLASAPNDGQGQSGAITVMELAQDGSLVDTDHVMDTADTHFGNVQAMEVVQADGRTYVIAGGGDDGLTLFVLLPHGRLQMLNTLSGEPGLENVSSLAAHYANGNLNMFVSSEVEGGVTQVTADVSNHGLIIEGDHGGGTITGGTRDDILIGGAGDDSIAGGRGNDILEDGLGIDTLHGGYGSDTFILRSDFTHDVIQDVQTGLDHLDLSAWPMLYDAAQIGYTATAHGALLEWRGETLEIVTRNGSTLTFTQVHAAILSTPDRVPDFSSYGGNDGDQLIDGTAIDDAVNAGKGADTITGFSGDDYIDTGAGNDFATGDDGNDVLIGEDRKDTMWGGMAMTRSWAAAAMITSGEIRATT